jgi:hypothetical protein
LLTMPAPPKATIRSPAKTQKFSQVFAHRGPTATVFAFIQPRIDPFASLRELFRVAHV